MTGCSLLHLDLPEMQALNPILYEQFSYAVNDENWLGLILPPSDTCQYASVMAAPYLTNALISFKSLWDGAMPISPISAPYAITTAPKPRRG